MSLGAARAGFRVVAGVDKDERALKAHKLNFPNSRHISIDLSRASGQDVLSQSGLEAGELDVLVGGPPCQGFSTMGKRNIADTRNLLICDFFRLVNELTPHAFVMENVPGILNEQYAPILDAAFAMVGPTYQVLKPHAISACDIGAPTLRKRVFVVGFRRGHTCPPTDFWTAPSLTDKAPIVRHALSGLPADINRNWTRSAGGIRTVKVLREGFFFESATARIPKGVGNPDSIREYQENSSVTGCLGTRHSADLEARYGALAGGEADSRTKSVRLSADGYCPTLRAGTGPERGSFQAVRPIHYLRPRVITPREAARLQGFPDWYQFDTTKWHSFRQIGNSVSPLVAEFVMKRVIGALTHAEQPNS